LIDPYDQILIICLTQKSTYCVGFIYMRFNNRQNYSIIGKTINLQR
jgi:hypothetical protein